MSTIYRLKAESIRFWHMPYRKPLVARFPDMCVVCGQPKAIVCDRKVSWTPGGTELTYEFQVPYCAEHGLLRRESESRLKRRIEAVTHVLFPLFICFAIPLVILFGYPWAYQTSADISPSSKPLGHAIVAVIFNAAIILPFSYLFAALAAQYIVAPLISAVVKSSEEKKVTDALKTKVRAVPPGTAGADYYVYLVFANDEFADEFARVNREFCDEYSRGHGYRVSWEQVDK